MKAALLAAALALAPTAHAQASCADLQRLLEEADSDFSEITGDEIDDDYFEAAFSLPGAESCTINVLFDSMYKCLWTLPNEAAATAFINDQLAAMRACLRPDAWAEEALATAPSNEWRLIRGATFTGGEDDELIFGARADASTKGQPGYEVEFSLEYLFF